MNLPVWITDPYSNRINFHEPFEVQYWMTEWEVTEQQLTEAKEQAGCSVVSEVYAQLKLSGLLSGDIPLMIVVQDSQ